MDGWMDGWMHFGRAHTLRLYDGTGDEEQLFQELSPHLDIVQEKNLRNYRLMTPMPSSFSSQCNLFLPPPHFLFSFNIEKAAQIQNWVIGSILLLSQELSLSRGSFIFSSLGFPRGENGLSTTSLPIQPREVSMPNALCAEVMSSLCHPFIPIL